MSSITNVESSLSLCLSDHWSWHNDASCPKAFRFQRALASLLKNCTRCQELNCLSFQLLFLLRSKKTPYCLIASKSNHLKRIFPRHLKWLLTFFLNWPLLFPMELKSYYFPPGTLSGHLTHKKSFNLPPSSSGSSTFAFYLGASVKTWPRSLNS